MNISDLHPWNVTYKKAIKIQERLKNKVQLKKIDKKIQYVAGLDVSYAKGSDIMWAGVVVLDFLSLKKVEKKWAQKQVSFPYIPGLLSFREIPVLLDALRKLEIEPDLVFCDGQGIAHPRGLGLASHMGIIVNKPTIGCAKSPLVGRYNQVGKCKGSYEYLIYKNRKIGAAVRTKSNVKPVFISPGYGIMLQDCIQFVLEACSTYRIPEPTRQAHLLVNSVRSGKRSGFL